MKDAAASWEITSGASKRCCNFTSVVVLTSSIAAIEVGSIIIMNLFP